jgi:hypothetical protein
MSRKARCVPQESTQGRKRLESWRFRCLTDARNQLCFDWYSLLALRARLAQRWCFEMPTQVSSHEVRAWIKESLRRRADIGLKNAIVNTLFEPPSPFDPRARRKPKSGFVIGAILSVTAVACFWYFNFVRS